ncbi:MAG: ABC-type transport system substrate-binding protein [Bacteroidia bacterium]|jgi:ABC-type transport system substrate-binding protein
MNRLLLLIHINLLLISCQSSILQENKKVFRYNAGNGITSLDPAFSSNQDNIWAVNQLFNGLVSLDTTLHAKPALAERWQITNNGKIYTFHLRNDVYFHLDPCFNGKRKKCTARDVQYSFERLVDPKTASPGAWIFNDKVGPKGFVVLDDSTFQITLNEAFAPFLGILSMSYCNVVPKEAIEYYGKSFGHHPVGTGPFQFFLWEDDVSLVLHKNSNYFETFENQRLPLLDAVQVSFIKNKEMALLQFLEGKSDLYNGLVSSVKDEVLTQAGTLKAKWADAISLEIQPFLNTEYLAMWVDDQSSAHPFNSIHFRQALNCAVNKDAMLQYLRNNIGRPANGGFIPIGLPGHLEQASFQYSPNRAIELLTQSGYLANPTPITLTTTAEYLDLCVYIQQQLNDVGVVCELEVLPSAQIKEAKRNGKLTFFRASWIMDYPDAENYLSCFYSPNFSPNGPNYTHFKNLEFDQLYQQALLEVNDNERLKIYHQMEEIIIREAPVLVLFYDESIRMLSKRVVNIPNNAINILNLKKADILPHN